MVCMVRLVRITATFISVFIACGAATDALAGCLEDNRQVSATDNSVVRVRGYLCTIGDQANGPMVRVEFHRFSDGSMSELTGNASSGLLTKVIGSPQLIQNEVVQTYMDLVRKFGTLTRVGRDAVGYRLELETPGKTSNRGQLNLQLQHQDHFRTLLDPQAMVTQNDYPALDEISSLKKRTVPEGLHPFYSVTCDDDVADASDRPKCSKVDRSASQLQMWRSLTSDDILSYAGNVSKYNSMLRRAKMDTIPTQTPKDLQLFQYISASDLPEDFSLLIGLPASIVCGDAPSDWRFQYTSRVLLGEAITITNVSTQDIELNGLVGSTSPARDLRPVGGADDQADALIGRIALNRSLQPNHSVIFFTRLKFVPDDTAKETFNYPQTSELLLKEIGVRGFKGNITDHKQPQLRDYVYGVQFSIGGIVANDQEVNFAGRSANFLNLTVASETGSCPYFLADIAGEWETYGKVLHESNSRARESDQTVVYAGFVRRIRFEEREREFARINQVSASYVLKDGAAVEVKPEDYRLIERDQSYLELSWGDSANIAFIIPQGLDPANIFETRITFTGYYVRDPDVAFSSDQPTVSSSMPDETGAAP
jgi:hypothetical protein